MKGVCRMLRQGMREHKPSPPMKEAKKMSKERQQKQRRSLKLKEPDKNLQPRQKYTPLPPVVKKMAKFQCINQKCCPTQGEVYDDIPESCAKTFTECPNCGSEVIRVDVYECAECAEKITVPYNAPAPGACVCGHIKLNLT